MNSTASCGGQSFKQYFNEELKDSIPKHAARFLTESSAFRNDVTATNNMSERRNRVIKDALEGKELRTLVKV